MTMAREVRISDRAARDLANVWQWWRASESQDRARAGLKAIGLAIRNLPFTPLASPLLPDTGARERRVGHHTIVYDVEVGGNLGPSAGHVNVLVIVGPLLGDQA
jgi:plasmid stabilization system protein ParE